MINYIAVQVFISFPCSTSWYVLLLALLQLFDSSSWRSARRRQRRRRRREQSYIPWRRRRQCYSYSNKHDIGKVIKIHQLVVSGVNVVLVYSSRSSSKHLERQGPQGIFPCQRPSELSPKASSLCYTRASLSTSSKEGENVLLLVLLSNLLDT